MSKINWGEARRDVEWANLKDENNKQKGMIEALEERRDELYSQIEVKDRAILNLENTVELLSNQRDRAEKELKESREFNRKIMEQNNELTKKDLTREREITSLHEEITRLSEDKTKMNKEILEEKRRRALPTPINVKVEVSP